MVANLVAGRPGRDDRQARAHGPAPFGPSGEGIQCPAPAACRGRGERMPPPLPASCRPRIEQQERPAIQHGRWHGGTCRIMRPPASEIPARAPDARGAGVLVRSGRAPPGPWEWIAERTNPCAPAPQLVATRVAACAAAAAAAYPLVPSPAARSNSTPRCSIDRPTGQTLQRPRPTAACHRLFPSLLPPNHLASRHVPSSQGTLARVTTDPLLRIFRALIKKLISKLARRIFLDLTASLAHIDYCSTYD